MLIKLNVIQQQSIHWFKLFATGVLLMLLLSNASLAEIKLSPQWTERYLFKHHPALVKNSHTDHVIAFYYFGSFQDYTIMGMERIKGDEYEPHNTLLIFKDSILQGYYEELLVFPAGVSEAGQIYFPTNRDVLTNVNLKNPSYPDIIFQANTRIRSIFVNLIAP
jgi:hypothetical protein